MSVGKLVRLMLPSTPMWATMQSSQAGKRETDMMSTCIYRLLDQLVVVTMIGKALASMSGITAQIINYDTRPAQALKIIKIKN